MNIDRRDFMRYSGVGVFGALNAPALLDGTQPGSSEARMGTLTVKVQGLCALVLDRELGQRGIPRAPSRAHVMLLDNVFATPGEPRHQPYLSLDPAVPVSQVPSGQKHLSGVDGLPAIQNVGYLDVRDFQITIEGPQDGPIALGTGRKTEASGAAAMCPADPTQPAEWEDISWVANMEEICGAGVIDGACLSMNPPRVVGGRVTLTGGKLRCTKPSDSQYSKKVWEFRPTGPSGKRIRQSIADSVEYTATARHFTLVLTPFEGVAGTQPVRIPLVAPDSGASVSLVINNAPDTTIHEPNSIAHFAAQYFLLPANQRPMTPPVPHVIENLPDCPQSKETATVLLGEPNYCPCALVFTR